MYLFIFILDNSSVIIYYLETKMDYLSQYCILYYNEDIQPIKLKLIYYFPLYSKFKILTKQSYLFLTFTFSIFFNKIYNF